MLCHNEKVYIIDYEGNYYKVSGKKGKLKKVDTSVEASIFSRYEANRIISAQGKKACDYMTVEADIDENCVAEFDYNDNQIDFGEECYVSNSVNVERPTLFEFGNNNWENCISQLCYMSSHMDDHIYNLNIQLSVVDRKITDIMHYVEFYDLTEVDAISTMKLLKEYRTERRAIKDEIEQTELMQSTFLDEEFSIKVHQTLEYMERMKHRKYTPRELPELFVCAS